MDLGVILIIGVGVVLVAGIVKDQIDRARMKRIERLLDESVAAIKDRLRRKT